MRDDNMSLINRIIVLSSVGLALGVLLGVFSGNIIDIISSGGKYVDKLHIYSPELALAVGGEFKALILQTLLSGLLGAVAMGLSAVYEIESWSIAKATLIHFSVTIMVFYLTAFFLKWWSLRLSFFMLVPFLIAYFTIWMVNYVIYRKRVNEINEALNEMKLKDDRGIER